MEAPADKDVAGPRTGLHSIQVVLYPAAGMRLGILFLQGCCAQ